MNNIHKTVIKLNNTFEIITPKFKRNIYEFDYRTPPLKSTNYIEYSRVIIKISNSYLLFEITFNSDIKVTRDHQEIIIQTDNPREFKIDIKLYEKLSDIFINSSYTIRNKTGLIFDCKSYKEVNFALLKNIIDFNCIILKNYEKIIDPDSFFEILRINEIKPIYEYNLENNNNSNCTLKYRDNSDHTYQNMQFIDYFSTQGRKDLKDSINLLFDKDILGIDIERITYNFLDIEGLDKAVIRFDKEIHPYKDYIKKGTKIINDIGIELENAQKSYYSPLVNKLMTKFIFKKRINAHGEDFFHDLFDFFLQGYNNISLFIDKKLCTSIYLIAILFSESFFISYEILNKISKNKNLINKINNILDLKSSLYLYYHNMEGILLRGFLKENKIKGIFIGESLYLGFIENFLFQRFFSLPEGSFFSIDNRRVISGNTFYLFNKSKNDFLMFQKENSVVPFYRPAEITFNIFVRNDLKISIKSDETDYNFNITFTKNRVEIVLTSEKRTDKKININFVNNNLKTDTVISEMEKIYFEDNDDLTSFSFIMNNSLRKEITIVFK